MNDITRIEKCYYYNTYYINSRKKFKDDQKTNNSHRKRKISRNVTKLPETTEIKLLRHKSDQQSLKT